MIQVSPGLTGEMDSLVRQPRAGLTVERFLPDWDEAQAHTGPDFACGHAACVATDGDGAGNDILFRARITATGELEIAVIKGSNLENPATWEALFNATGITGFMRPNWTNNSGSEHGGALDAVWDEANTLFRLFTFTAAGDIKHYDFDYNGLQIASATIISFTTDDNYLTSCILAACRPDELFFVRRVLVEINYAPWQKAVYGSKVYRAFYNAGWQIEDSFLFHTHADAGLVRDNQDYDSGSAGIVEQWGFRPTGGIGVINVDDDTVLIVLGLRFYMHLAYKTHTQGVAGFLYHRDNGLWERSFYNDEADYDDQNQLWLNTFVASSPESDGRHIISWVRLAEPADFEQVSGFENIHRNLETVYALISADGRNITQFQYLGDPVELAATRVLSINHAGVKLLCAVGHSAILASDPANLLCDVPDTYKLNMELVTNNYQVSRSNRWSMAIKTGLIKGSGRFETFLREGQLVRAFYGYPGETIQIGQGIIDLSQITINQAQRYHKGPLTARAEFHLMYTRAEAIEDILPMKTITIGPEGTPCELGPLLDVSGATVQHPANVAYHKGWWLLRKANWPEKFFTGVYDHLASILVYRMEAFPWAMTGGGSVNLKPGQYGGPGEVADPRKDYKRGTFFNDIAWVTLEPHIDAAIQAAVRFGDDINYGNFSFRANSGCAVSTQIHRTNGLIDYIKWFSDDCGMPPGADCPDPDCWNYVPQGSTMVGLICRAVQGDYSDDVAGKKYIFCWEANSDFGLGEDDSNRGSHLGDRAGAYWGTLVHDRPDYGEFPVGRNKLYLMLSDFDDGDPDWQSNNRWIHQAIAHTDATGLTPGKAAEMKLQVLGGVIHCFYRPYWEGNNPRTLWRHAFSHNSGHNGAGRVGLVARGHSGIQWDTLWPGRNYIDQTDNVCDFWDIEATDGVRDMNLEELATHYAWQGLTETEFRSDVNVAGPVVVNANTLYTGINYPVENPCLDFTVEISDDGGEAGVFVRAVTNGDPLADCVLFGIVANSTYKNGDKTLNCYVVFRRYEDGNEVADVRDYSPCPFQIKPNTPYRVRVSLRNDLYSMWVEGNYVGHFHLDEELGQYFGLYANNENATFTNIRLPELHEIFENATLDPGQDMMGAIKAGIGHRHIKGVWRPYGKLLISYFKNHDIGPSFENNLLQNQYEQSDQFYSAVEVLGASQRATYANSNLMARGRRYTQVNNPNLMTVEACYREARLILQEIAEQMVQATFTSPPDVRLEPEDQTNIIITQQEVNGTYMVDDIVISFDLDKHQAEMQTSTRQQYIL